jgi:PAS domain S-box-containing protein
MKPFDEQEISGVIEIALYKKEMELKLKAAHDELEQRVRERTAELQKANEELAHEIEERTQAEKKLQETKNTLTSILTSATEYAIAATDLRFRILHYNPAAERIFGYKAEEVLGRTVQEMHTREKIAPERFENAIRAVSEHGKYEYEVIDQDSTGEKRFIHSVVMPMSDEKGEVTGYILFARDVTKIRALQVQVVRSERLAATGQLAASVAHEINSPLQAIFFILNTLKQESGHDKEASDKIDLLKGAFTSIRDTVKSLLDLNRPGKDMRQQTDINRVIEKTITLIRTQLKKNGVKLHQALSAQIPNFTASPQQLNHVFLNLFNNSVEAMAGISKGGKMGLAGRGEISVKTNLRKGHVVIKFADNGPGISEEDLEHIFDPFFTRKKTMGLGVGLSVCHDIVEGHGGTITAGNAPEGGTVFTITLPLD